jgi:hypothetical protein
MRLAYGDAYGSGHSYTYGDGYSYSYRHTVTHADVRAGRTANNTLRLEQQWQPWRGCLFRPHRSVESNFGNIT